MEASTFDAAGDAVHLYELAMELGERSADLADAAPALGLTDISPTSELTPEQVALFRARYAKAPVAPGPPPSGGSSYQMPATWGPPGGGAPLLPPPSPPPSSGGGLGMGQVLAIALAVAAVLGLFAFMVKQGGTDQKRLDEIAKAPPADSTPELTPKEQAFADALADQEKAKQAKVVQVCAVLQKLSDADAAASVAARSADTVEEILAQAVQARDAAWPIYDEIIAVWPEQAPGVQALKQVTQETVDVVQGATDANDLQQRLVALQDRMVSSGAYDAAVAIDDYATENCGFSTSNN